MSKIDEKQWISDAEQMKTKIRIEHERIKELLRIFNEFCVDAVFKIQLRMDQKHPDNEIRAERFKLIIKGTFIEHEEFTTLSDIAKRNNLRIKLISKETYFEVLLEPEIPEDKEDTV